jgi:NADH-quinone oxidoreductase subunit J
VTASDLLLVAFGAIAVGAAVLVVTTRHVVRAGLWLVVTLGAVAATYLILSAELLAWVQVLLYVGAVVVLLLFAVMLTRAPIGASVDLDRPKWPAAVVGGGSTVALGALLASAYRWHRVPRPVTGTAERLGGEVFTAWVLPFEVVGILVLAALIGAIVVSRSERAAPTDPPAAAPALITRSPQAPSPTAEVTELAHATDGGVA